MIAGIDVGARFSLVSTPSRTFKVYNNRIDDLISRLTEDGIKKVILEPTGRYHIPLIVNLHPAFEVLIVHTTRFAQFRKAFSRNKTDESDAELLRRYLESGGEVFKITDKDVEMLYLNSLIREHFRLKRMLTAEMNRIRQDVYEVEPSLAFMTPSSYKLENLQHIGSRIINERARRIEKFRELLKDIDKEIKDIVESSEDGKILITIPGISHTTAALLMTRYIDAERFSSVKHFKSFLGFGLNTTQSGTSINHVRSAKAHIPIRSAMFRVVLSNVNRDNKIGEYYHRYRKRMPFKKAVMRTGAKIIEWIYHMLKNREGWRDDY